MVNLEKRRKDLRRQIELLKKEVDILKRLVNKETALRLLTGSVRHTETTGKKNICKN